MRAIIIKQFGGLESLAIENLPDPAPKPGSVLIEVKAFGINHAETHMRKGEWAELRPTQAPTSSPLLAKNSALTRC